MSPKFRCRVCANTFILPFDVTNPRVDFAIETTPEQNVTVMTSGSGHSPWQVWYIDGMTAHQQASQVAVGIISRGPTYNSPPPYSPEEIQIELVCMQAPQSPSSASNSND